MAIASDVLKLKYSYFHANSKYLQRESHDYLYNSTYKAGHVVLTNEIMAESVPWFTSTQITQLDAWIAANPGIIKKYTNFNLTAVSGSSNEMWYINDTTRSNEWMKPIIMPELITNSLNAPATAYTPKLYKSDGTQISGIYGVWWFDPYQGVVRFGDGYNPGDTAPAGTGSDDTSGWGIPQITCYVYIGKRLNTLLTNITPSIYKYTSSIQSTEHIITHGLNSLDLDISTLVQDPNDTSVWRNDWVGMEFIDLNSLKIYLTISANIKCNIQLIK